MSAVIGAISCNEGTEIMRTFKITLWCKDRCNCNL